MGVAFLISLKFIGKSHAQEEGEAQAVQAAQAAEAQTTQTNAAPTVPAPQAAPAVPDPSRIPPPTANAAPPAMPAVTKSKAPDAGGSPRMQGTGNSELSSLEGFLEPFIYDVVNRRDPFLAYSEYIPQDIAAPARPLSPAQRFDLDQLRLVAIMWDVKDPKAMFMDPEAEVIVLGRDEGIGNRNGYIASIREGEVVVVEAIRKRGDIIYKTRVLRIER